MVRIAISVVKKNANELLASVCIIQSSTMLALNLPYDWNSRGREHNWFNLKCLCRVQDG